MEFENKNEKLFILYSCITSAIQGVLYITEGIIHGFNQIIIIMAVMDFLYIPAVLIFRSRGFKIYILIESLLILYCTSIENTYLYNNFSALLCLFMAILIFPKYKNIFMPVYLFASAIMFAINAEHIYLWLIHASRACWLFVIEDYIIYSQYNKKPMILTEEEKQIISQLCDNKLQKEIELGGASESTIRRRIASAKERNGIKTTEELKELYLKNYGNHNN